MAQQSDFQKAFLAKGTGQTLYTRKEVDAELDGMIAGFQLAARDIIERERSACAKIAYDEGQIEIAKKILNRLENLENADIKAAIPTIDKPLA